MPFDGRPSQQELEFIIKMRDEASRVLRDVGGTTERTGRQARDTGQQFREMARSLGEVTAGLATMYAQARLIRGALGTFGELESQMIAVAKTTDQTAAETEQFTAQFREMAREIPQARATLAEIAVVAGQLGIRGTDNILSFTKVIAELGSASNLAGEEAATALTRMLNVMGEGIGEARRLSDVIVTLGNNAATNERQIAEMATEIALATATFEIGTTAAAGIGAAMAEMGLRAEVSGTAVGRTFRAIDQALKTGEGRSAVEALTNLIGPALDQAFENDPTEVFEKFIEGLGAVIDQGGNYYEVLEELGLQQEEVNKTIVPLASNYERFALRLRQANTAAAEGGATAEEAARAYESFNAQVQLLQNAFQDFVTSVGEALAPLATEIIQTVTDALNNLNDAFQDLPQPVQEFIAVGAGIAPMAAGAGLAIKGATFALGPFTAAIGTAAVALGPAGLAIAAVTAGAIALGVQLGKTTPTIRDFRDVQDEVKEATDLANQVIEGQVDANSDLGESVKETLPLLLQEAQGHLAVAEAMIARLSAARDLQREGFAEGAAPGESGFGTQIDQWRQDAQDARSAIIALEDSIAGLNREAGIIGGGAGGTLAGAVVRPPSPSGSGGEDDPETDPPRVPSLGGGSGSAPSFLSDLEAFERQGQLALLSDYQRQVAQVEQEFRDLREAISGAANEEELLARAVAARDDALRALALERDREVAKIVEQSDAVAGEIEALSQGQEAYEAYNRARQIDSNVAQFRESLEAAGAEKQKVDELTAAYRQNLEQKDAVEAALKEFGPAADQAGQAFSNFASSMILQSDSMAEALSRLSLQLAEIALQAGLLEPLQKGISGIVSGLLVPSAQGNVFGRGVTGHLNEVISQPTLFAFAKGVGLMGEAGDEAVMPLVRLSNGDLGVQAQGGGGSVVFAPRTSVSVQGGSSGDQQADQRLAEQIGRELDEIMNAKMAEFMQEQQRPGNMLNPGYGDQLGTMRY